MKKIPFSLIFTISIVIIGICFWVIPQISISIEQKQYGRLQTNNAMMTSKILFEFSQVNKKTTPTEIVSSLSKEMNELVKNPINKNNPAYSVMKECEGCVVIVPDDKVQSIVLTAKDKSGELVSRTIIQPPSHITFNKDLKQK